MRTIESRTGTCFTTTMSFMTAFIGGIARGGRQKLRAVRVASNPLAFFSYRWVRYQERRLMSIGGHNVHVKRRLRIAIAP